ncbi:hypothetical protein GW17_00021296 [Ensete ventricosum]|nr:hypothetical protein GW17_00021296 [Ensete ventricosum]
MPRAERGGPEDTNRDDQDDTTIGEHITRKGDRTVPAKGSSPPHLLGDGIPFCAYIYVVLARWGRRCLRRRSFGETRGAACGTRNLGRPIPWDGWSTGPPSSDSSKLQPRSTVVIQLQLLNGRDLPEIIYSVVSRPHHIISRRPFVNAFVGAASVLASRWRQRARPCGERDTKHRSHLSTEMGPASLTSERCLETPNPVALVSSGEDEKRESTAGNEVGKAAMSKRDCSGPSLPSLHRNNLQGRDRSAQWVVET